MLLCRAYMSTLRSLTGTFRYGDMQTGVTVRHPMTRTPEEVGMGFTKATALAACACRRDVPSHTQVTALAPVTLFA